jgi:KDO2-lipid IV(A) lauroyltransferase
VKAAYFHPKYWPTWLGIGALRIFEPLPHRLLYLLGRGLGFFVFLFPTPFKRIARRNLELALPELVPAARERILREHFAGLGCALFETAMSWWSSNERIRHITLMTGLENLKAAQATGRGVLLLSAHFNSIEISCRALAARLPLNVMYRPTKNPLVGEFLHSRRAVQTKRAIPRDDVRTLIKALKDGDVVWYAPDQSFRKKGAEMVKLFGIPAATNTATSRIAGMTRALVLPYFFERLPGGGYRGTIHPALENFPTDDPVADTERFNRIVEAEVRRMPDQYLWIHRRFKGLTPDYPKYYD